MRRLYFTKAPAILPIGQRRKNQVGEYDEVGRTRARGRKKVQIEAESITRRYTLE